LKSAAEDLEGAVELNLDAVDLPDPEVPEADAYGEADTLIDSRDSWLDQTRGLIDAKSWSPDNRPWKSLRRRNGA